MLPMVSIQPGNAVNVVTQFRYGPGGRLEALIARNPETGDQVTRYEYGVTLADSDIASNDLLRAEVYPDSANSSDRVTYSYNRQGQRIKITDQNGSVHEYDYDALGRQTADKVPTLASGVDGAVRRIGQSYEVRGMVEKVTSCSDAAGTTVVNEVQNAYNSFGQLVTQYQEHSGSVNTGTTPKVKYAYADGSANTIRPTSMTYPNGRVLEYRYDVTAADKLSRVRTLRFDGTDVCQYTYLGLGTFVTTDYSQPQVKLDYAMGSGVNPYTGFDRFGRIIDLLWAKYGGPASDLVHLKYGYDQASNRTYREDLVAQSFNKDFDELYEYDGMQRLQKFHRGRLTADKKTITSPQLLQGWQLDATGNWQNFTQNDQVDAAQTLDQQRIANRVNEITQIARTVGPNWATPSYDRNGNMIVIPQPKDMTTTFQGTWDAWNRLVKLTEPNGSGGWHTLQENAYNGQTWRTVVKMYASGTLSETRHVYFTSNWQNIEDRLSTTPSTAAADRQIVWGLRYIDDIILRDRDSDANGTLDERLFGMQDANWNVVAIQGSNGSPIQRYTYTAYGVPTIYSTAFIPIGDGGVDWEIRFSGYYYDRFIEIYNVRMRSYLTSLGRWTQRDPVNYTVLSLNLYNYCSDNPVGFVDPLGLKYARCDFDRAIKHPNLSGKAAPWDVSLLCQYRCFCRNSLDPIDEGFDVAIANHPGLSHRDICTSYEYISAVTNKGRCKDDGDDDCPRVPVPVPITVPSPKPVPIRPIPITGPEPLPPVTPPIKGPLPTPPIGGFRCPVPSPVVVGGGLLFLVGAGAIIFAPSVPVKIGGVAFAAIGAVLLVPRPDPKNCSA
jgi:RHS repeat-associated protein